jgi:hypothetical protein
MLAQKESRRCGLDYTGVEQLLVGLRAVEVLRQLGVDMLKLEKRVLDLLKT